MRKLLLALGLIVVALTGVSVASSATAAGAPKPARTFLVTITGVLEHSYSSGSCSPVSVLDNVVFHTTSRVVASYSAGAITYTGGRATGTRPVFDATGTERLTRTLTTTLPPCQPGEIPEQACIIGTPRPVTGLKAVLAIDPPSGQQGTLAAEPAFRLGVNVLGPQSTIATVPPYAASCSGALQLGQKEMAPYQPSGCRRTAVGKPHDTKCSHVTTARFTNTKVGGVFSTTASFKFSLDRQGVGANYLVSWTARFKRLS